MRVWILMLVLLAPARAFATVVLPADFATVVNGADIIVSGRVVDVRSQLTEARSIESFIDTSSVRGCRERWSSVPAVLDCL